MRKKLYKVLQKNFFKKIIKKLNLLEDLKMSPEFYTLLNFNFVMIYIIYRILLLIKNHLNKLVECRKEYYKMGKNAAL